MNPYDPNDALGDRCSSRSETSIIIDVLNNETKSEEFKMRELNSLLRVTNFSSAGENSIEIASQYNKGRIDSSISGLMSSEITVSENSASPEISTIEFNDPNNEIDYNKIEEAKIVAGTIIPEIIQKFESPPQSIVESISKADISKTDTESKNQLNTEPERKSEDVLNSIVEHKSELKFNIIINTEPERQLKTLPEKEPGDVPDVLQTSYMRINTAEICLEELRKVMNCDRAYPEKNEYKEESIAIPKSILLPSSEMIEQKSSEGNTSVELLHILAEAKALFERPENSDIVEDIKSKSLFNKLTDMSPSNRELKEIETKLRECKLAKSQEKSKNDVRLNQLTLRDIKNKIPEQRKSDKNTSEIETKKTASTLRNNFCELLYKSALLNCDADESTITVTQYQDLPKKPASPESIRSKTQYKQTDDLKILRRAVQLLESRSSLQTLPNNGKGILGILALQKKLQDLLNDKDEFESRLYKCNSDFMEFIDILSDKARIISINNKEVANFIKLLNLKVPELETATTKHTKSLEDIKYRFKERNLAKIIELRNQIKFYNVNINKLQNKIARIKTENSEIKKQMEYLEVDNLNYKTYFTKKVSEVKANMDNLHNLNSDLQRQLEIVQNSDLGKNENFKQKIPSLKKEIEILSNNIKTVRREKNNYEIENSELRKKLKKLILTKVMERRATPDTASS